MGRLVNGRDTSSVDGEDIRKVNSELKEIVAQHKQRQTSRKEEKLQISPGYAKKADGVKVRVD